MTDYDPRIVDLYDGDNPDGPDHDYYRALAEAADAKSVVDLGCGTGMLTVTLARAGRRVVGVDPSAAMIDYARRRPGAELVEWVHGDADDIPAGPHDFAVMTGNVAQHIPDGAWQRTLAALASVLRPGALLAFESRNPDVRAWEQWAAAEASTRQTIHGELREYDEITELEPGVVEMVSHNEFVDAGERVVGRTVLMFRSRDAITAALQNAGFAVRAVHGGWAGEPLETGSRVMVFEAVRAAAG